MAFYATVVKSMYAQIRQLNNAIYFALEDRLLSYNSEVYSFIDRTDWQGRQPLYNLDYCVYIWPKFLQYVQQ